MTSGSGVAGRAGLEDLRAWAREVAAAHTDVALVLLFEPAPGAPAGDEVRVCLVMKDGVQVEWFAEGKGIDGLTYASVPGQDVRERLAIDPRRLARPGVRVYLNFCDARALMVTRDHGRERLADAELVGRPYRILYPEPDGIPPLDEFFYVWGDGLRRDDADG